MYSGSNLPLKFCIIDRKALARSPENFPVAALNWLGAKQSETSLENS